MSEPLHFPRADVRCILLREARPGGAKERPEGLRATVQFADGNWLYGDLRSPDGENFTLKSPDGAEFEFQRTQVTLCQFGETPVPGFGFFGSAVDLDQWRCPSGPSEIAVEDGVLTMHKMEWLWHPLAPMDRLEVLVEFPPGEVHGVEVALAADVKLPTSVYAGNAELYLTTDKVSVSATGGKEMQKSAPIADPRESLRKATVYRLFYDRPGGRLTVFRDEAKFLELDLGEHWPIESNRQKATGIFQGIFLKQSSMANYVGLRIQRLEARPWDGVLPSAEKMAAESGRLRSGKDGPVMGKLESISRDEIRQAGVATPIEVGTSVRFTDARAESRDFECLIDLGENGQFKARGLEIDGSVVICTPAFGAAKKISLGALEEIVFPAKGPLPAAGDTLLFKDGDALRGLFLEATSGAAVRWQMPDKREVAILSGLIAGVRFQRGPTENEDRQGILELRNGDLAAR